METAVHNLHKQNRSCCNLARFPDTGSSLQLTCVNVNTLNVQTLWVRYLTLRSSESPYTHIRRITRVAVVSFATFRLLATVVIRLFVGSDHFVIPGHAAEY